MNNGEFDILQLISIALGLQNLSENREQSAHNDVERANDKQAEFLLQEIRQLFHDQNRRLAKQNMLLKKIARLLEILISENKQENN